MQTETKLSKYVAVIKAFVLKKKNLIVIMSSINDSQREPCVVN